MRQQPTFFELLDGRVPHHAVEPLAAYGDILEKWSKRHNLVRVADRRELADRHLVESLAPIDHLDTTGRLVDVGSGAGLPGIPLLCALKNWTGLLVEPRQKRWAFLNLVIRELGLGAQVVRSRYEEVTETGFDLVTSRAVGGHEALLGWANGHINQRGAVALWGTVDEARRLGGLSGWSVVSSPLPGLERGRLIFFKVCST